MKRFSTILLAMAAVVVAAVSCNKEGNEPEGKMAVLSYEVNLSEVATKAIGDGSTVNRLAYSIYDNDTKYASEVVEGSGSFNFKPSLYFGKEYDIVLFAYVDGAYDVADLTAVKKNAVYGENADAFCLKQTILIDKDETVIINGDDSNKSFRDGLSVVLKRQFAQLNIGTKPLEDLTKVGAAKVKVSISNYNAASYNVRTGSVNAAENTSVEYVYTIDDIKDKTFDITVGEGAAATTTTYNYVSLNYLFPVGTVNADVTVLKEDDTVIRTVEFKNLPLVANQKTNIYGNLVKGELTFNVSLNTVFGKNDQDKDNEVEIK